MKKVASLWLFTLIFIYSNSNVMAQEKKLTINFNGSAYVRYTADESSNTKDAFTIPMIRLNILGDITNEISYRMQLDEAAGTGGNYLRDFYIDLKYLKNNTIRLGQFIIPIGIELPTPPYFLETIILSQMSYYFSRDIGIMLMGKSKDIEYKLALINGTGTGSGGTPEQDDKKDICINIGKKFKKWHTIRLMHYEGKIGTGQNKKQKIRDGIEVEYKKDKLYSFGEYLIAKDGNIKSNIYYIHLSYFTTPLLQPLIRYDRRDHNTNVDNDEIAITTLGFNYFLDKLEKNAIIRINYQIKKETPKINNNCFVAQLGIRF